MTGLAQRMLHSSKHRCMHIYPTKREMQHAAQVLRQTRSDQCCRVVWELGMVASA